MEEGRYNGDSYTPTEAALVLGVTPTRVRQLLQDGELEGARDGAGHWSIPPASCMSACSASAAKSS